MQQQAGAFPQADASAAEKPEPVFAEDLEVGVPQQLGRFEMTRGAIVAFAEQWDPQPIHIDAEVAADGRFGALIASGLHTFAVFNRLANLTVYPGWALIAGRDAAVSFVRAVREGVVVTGSVTVESVTPYSPRSSTVIKRGELHDAATGAPLFEMRATTYMRRRPER